MQNTTVPECIRGQPATNMCSLRYSLNTYHEIAAFLKSGNLMRVSDVYSA